MALKEKPHITSIKGSVVTRLIKERDLQLKKSTNPNEHFHLMDLKLQHIAKVVFFTDTLIERMGGIIEGEQYHGEQWNKTMAETIAWWHDGARFEEIKLNGQVNKQKFNHSKIGTSKFKRIFSNPKYHNNLNEENVDLERAVEAIYNHGEKSYEGNDPYALLIRDADKLAICKNISSLMDTFIVSDKLKEGPVSPLVEKEFREGSINNGSSQTVADGLLRILTWYNDLNFETSRKIWKELKIDEQIRSELVKRGINWKIYFKTLNRLTD